MFAELHLWSSPAATRAIGVPEDAVIYEGDTARVWVAHAGRALELRQIKAGAPRTAWWKCFGPEARRAES